MWKTPEETILPDDASDDDKAKQQRKLCIYAWYVDYWLGNAAGFSDFGPSTRHCKMAVDKISLKKGSDGDLHDAVTVQSEAFAILVYMNCWKKWIAVSKYKNESSS